MVVAVDPVTLNDIRDGKFLAQNILRGFSPPPSEIPLSDTELELRDFFTRELIKNYCQFFDEYLPLPNNAEAAPEVYPPDPMDPFIRSYAAHILARLGSEKSFQEDIDKEVVEVASKDDKQVPACRQLEELHPMIIKYAAAAAKLTILTTPNKKGVPALMPVRLIIDCANAIAEVKQIAAPMLG